MGGDYNDGGCNKNYEIVGSTVVGVVVLISEVMPFVKNVKSNGIMHAMYQFYKSYTEKKNNPDTIEAILTPPPTDPASGTTVVDIGQPAPIIPVTVGTNPEQPSQQAPAPVVPVPVFVAPAPVPVIIDSGQPSQTVPITTGDPGQPPPCTCGYCRRYRLTSEESICHDCSRYKNNS